MANFSFKHLLSRLPRGEPLTTQWLRDEFGLDANHAARLGRSGWLTKLGRGVFLLPGDTLDMGASLALLAKQTPGLHVSGRTALAWRGVRHNIPTKERIALWSDAPTKLPSWLTEHFPCRLQTTHIFDASMPASLGLAPLPTGRADLPVSTPERAILELLSDAGKFQSLEETRHLVECARNLRLSLFEELLSHLSRIKVARLATDLAESLELPWKDVAKQHSARLGGAARWIAVTRTGERLDLKRRTDSAVETSR